MDQNLFLMDMQRKILDGVFKSKEETINYLQKVSQLLDTDYETQQLFSENFNIKTKEDFEEVTKKILEYYDEKRIEDTGLLNIKATEFTNQTQDYIKVNQGDGNFVVMEDSDQRSFTDEFKARQNESLSNNPDDVIKGMRDEKVELSLEQSPNVNKDNLSEDDLIRLKVLKEIDIYKQDEFLVDPVNNVFINKRTGEPLYVQQNNQGNYEVIKATGDRSSTIVEQSQVHSKREIKKMEKELAHEAITEGAKTAGNVFLQSEGVPGPFAGMIVDAAAEQPQIKKALNRASKKIRRIPGATKILAQAKPILDQAGPLINSSGGDFSAVFNDPNAMMGMLGGNTSGGMLGGENMDMSNVMSMAPGMNSSLLKNDMGGKRLNLVKPQGPGSNAAFVDILAVAFAAGFSLGMIAYGIVNIIRGLN